MSEHQIQCPHCGQSYQLQDMEYAEIVKQVRDDMFTKEVSDQIQLLQEKLQMEHEQAIKDLEFTHEKAVSELQRQQKDVTSRYELQLKEKELEEQRHLQDSKMEIVRLENEVKSLQTSHALDLQTMKQSYDMQLSLKEEQLEYYRDFKAKQSTKMVGESLEQYCMNQFNQIRMTAFPNAYFEKDNEVSKSGSKGDFIFRESVDGVEFLSIMFEMKNEMDTTATKHKNADFFKELDKDRREKHCEYAVLVSMLEEDSDLYNTGIVDVSYQYPKMYVVRPQFFLTLISLLRNSSMHSIELRREMQLLKSQEIDVTHFEEDLDAFKQNIGRNYDLASRQFQDAITALDKGIDQLQKVKASLLSSERNLRLMNDKSMDLSIRRLVKNNPTMKTLFEEK